MATFEELYAQQQVDNRRAPGDDDEPQFELINGVKVNKRSTPAPSIYDKIDAGAAKLFVPGAPISATYDKERYDFPIYAGENPEEIGAQNQTAGDYSKAFLGNFTGSFAASVGGVTSILVGGVPQMISNAMNGGDAADVMSGAFDNPVSKVFNDFQNYMKTAAPVYKSQEVQDKPWYEYMVTPEFLAEDAASGLGYFAGAYASGRIAGAVMNKFMPGSIRGNKDLFTINNGIQGTQETGAAMATPVGDIAKLATAVAPIKNGNFTSQFAISMTMAAGEASAEATGVKQNLIQKLKDDRDKGLNVLSDEEIEHEANMGADLDFAINLPIIAVTDMLLFGRQLAGGYASSVKAASKELEERNAKNILKKTTTEAVGETVEKKVAGLTAEDVFYETTVAPRQKWFERIKRAGEGFIEEGGQEWAQYIQQETSTDYYGSRFDENGRKQTLGVLGSYMSTLENKALSKEAIISTLLGGLMGSPTQVIQGSKQRKADHDKIGTAAEYLKLDKWTKHLGNLENIIQAQVAQNDGDAAVKIKDELLKRNADSTQLMTFIKLVEKNGVGEMATERIKKLKDVSADKLKVLLNQQDKINFTEEDKNKLLDRMIEKINEGRKAYQNVELRWGTLSEAVKDTIYHATTGIENFDKRQKKLADKINLIFHVEFPNLPPFDFNEYINLSTLAGEGTIEEKKEKISIWKQTAKEYISSIKNVNPEIYESLKRELNDLFRLSDMREVYVRNFNEALANPTEFDYAAKKEVRIKEIQDEYVSREDAEFYMAHTDDDLITEKDENGNDVPIEGYDVYGFLSDKFSAELINPEPVTPVVPEATQWGTITPVPKINKIEVEIAPSENGELTFVDSKTGKKYSRKELKNIAVIKTINEQKDDYYDTFYKKLRQADIDELTQKEITKDDEKVDAIRAILDTIDEKLEQAKKTDDKATKEASVDKGNKALNRAISRFRQITLSKTSGRIPEINDYIVGPITGKSFIITAIDDKKISFKNTVSQVEGSWNKTVFENLLKTNQLEYHYPKAGKTFTPAEFITSNPAYIVQALTEQYNALLFQLGNNIPEAEKQLIENAQLILDLASQGKNYVDFLPANATNKSLKQYNSLIEQFKKEVYENTTSDVEKNYAQALREVYNEYKDLPSFKGLTVDQFVERYSNNNFFVKIIRSERIPFDALNTPSVNVLGTRINAFTGYKGVIELEDAKEEQQKLLKRALAHRNKLLKRRNELIADRDIKHKAIELKYKRSEIALKAAQLKPSGEELNLKHLDNYVKTIVKEVDNREDRIKILNALADKLTNSIDKTKKLLKGNYDLINKVFEKKFGRPSEILARDKAKLDKIVLTEIDKSGFVPLIAYGEGLKDALSWIQRNIPAKAAERLSSLQADAQELEDALIAINEAKKELSDISTSLQKSKDFYNKILTEIRIATNRVIKPVVPVAPDVAQTNGEAQSMKVEVDDLNNDLSKVMPKPDSYKKSIWDMFGSTGSSEGVYDEAKDQQNWFKSLFTMNLQKDKFKLKLVTQDSFSDLFDNVKNENNSLYPDTDGKKTVVGILYKQINGTYVPVDVNHDELKTGLVFPKSLVYTALPLPKWQHNSVEFGERFHDAGDDAVKSKKQMDAYTLFLDTVIQQNKDNNEGVFVDVDTLSNGIFDEYTGKRPVGGPDTTLPVMSQIFKNNKSDYDDATLFVSTNASGSQIVNVSGTKRSVNLTRGVPFLKLGTGTIIPLSSRNLDSKEVETIYNLLKRAADPKFGIELPFAKNETVTEKIVEKQEGIKDSDSIKNWKVQTKVADVIKSKLTSKKGYHYVASGKKSGYFWRWGKKKGVVERSNDAYSYDSKTKEYIKVGGSKTSKTTTVTKNVNKGENIFSYLRSIMYWGKHIKKEGGNLIANPNLRTVIYDDIDPIDKKRYLFFPSLKTYTGDRAGIIGKDIIKVEFTVAGLESVKDELQFFLATKKHQIKNAKAQNTKEPFYHITDVTGDVITTEKYDNYKDYLLSDKHPGGKTRPVEKIPFTSAIVGPNIFKSRYLTFNPYTVITKDKEDSVAPDDSALYPANPVSSNVGQAPTTEALKAAANQGVHSIDPQNLSQYFSPGDPHYAVIKEFQDRVAAQRAAAAAAAQTGTPVQTPVQTSTAAPASTFSGTGINFMMDAYDTVVNKLNKDFEKTDLDKAADNLKKYLPQVTFRRVLNALVDNKYYGVASAGMVTLSSLAPEGSEHHEGFHEVTQGLLSPAERILLYTAAQTVWTKPTVEQLEYLHKLYPNQTAEELVETYYEEKLAEAFRQYMLIGDMESIRELDKAPEVKSFLQKIFDFFIDFYNKIFKPVGVTNGLETTNKGEINKEIAKLFGDIKSGKYANKPIKSFEKTQKRFSPFTEDISVKLNQEIMNYVTMEYFSEATKMLPIEQLASIKNNDLSKILNVVLAKTRKKLIEIRNKADVNLYTPLDIDMIDKSIKALGVINQDTETFEHSNKFKNAFNIHLRNYGFNFETGTTDNLNFDVLLEQQDSTNAVKDLITLGGGKQYVQISAKQTANNLIKLLIAGLPAVDINDKPIVGEYGLPQPVEWGSTFSMIQDALSGHYTYKEQMQVLSGLAEIKPELKYLLKIMNSNSTTYNFKKIFQMGMYNTKGNHMTGLINEDNRIYFVNSLIDSTQKQIKKKWMQNLWFNIISVDDNKFNNVNSNRISLFSKDKFGRTSFNYDALERQFKHYETTRANKKTSAVDYELLIQILADPLGVKFSNFKAMDLPLVLNKLVEIYQGLLLDKETAPVTTPESLIEGTYNKTDKNDNQTSRFDILSEQETLGTYENITNEFRGPDGEIRFGLHKPSFVNKITDGFNTTKNREEQFIKFPHLNTVATKRSILWKLDGHLYNADGGKKSDAVFDSSFFTGLEDTKSQFGDTTVNLSKGARMNMYIAAAFPNLKTKDKLINLGMIWNSDKSLSNGFITKPFYEQSDFTEEVMPDAVVEQFLEYLKYDLDRNALLNVKSDGQAGTGANIKNYGKRVNSLGIFKYAFRDEAISPGLKNELTRFLTESYTEDELDDFIHNNEAGFAKEIRKIMESFLVEKAIADYNSFYKNKLITVKTVKDKYGKDEQRFSLLGTEFQNLTLAEFRAVMYYFTATTMTMNFEQLLFVTGDTNFYGNILQVFKRISQMAAIKSFASMEEGDNEAIANENLRELGHRTRDDGKMPDGFINSLALADLSIEAFDMKFIKDAIIGDYGVTASEDEIKALYESYSDINEADGVGLMSLYEYREWRQRTGAITPEFEKAYKKAVKGELLTDKDMYYFKPEKLHVGGFQAGSTMEAQDSSDRLAAPVVFKFCIVPVLPSVLKSTKSVAENYFNSLFKRKVNPIGMIVVGPKVGTVMQPVLDSQGRQVIDTETKLPKFEEDTFYKKIGGLAFPNEGNINEKVSMRIPYDILGMQVRIKDKPEEWGVLGTQVKKIVMANSFSAGEPKPIQILDKKSLSLTTSAPANTVNLIKVINETMSDLVIAGQNNLIDMLGLEEISARNGVRRFKVVNWNKVTSILKDRLDKAGVSEYNIDAIDTKEDAEGVIRLLHPLDAVSDRNRIENILMSLVNKEVLNPHVFGGAKILASVMGMDSTPRSVKNGKIQSSDDLLNYREDPITGITLGAQIKVPLPNKYRSVAYKFGGREAMNAKLLEIYGKHADPMARYLPENAELVKLTQVIAYRIPTQAPNSVDFFEIVEFLPEESHSTIYANSEIVKKTGADFDVDKLNFIFPEWTDSLEGADYNGSDFTSILMDVFKEYVTLPETSVPYDKKTTKKLLDEGLLTIIQKIGNFKTGIKNRSGLTVLYNGAKGLVELASTKNVEIPGFTEKEKELILQARNIYFSKRIADIKIKFHEDNAYTEEALTRPGYDFVVNSTLTKDPDVVLEKAAVNGFITATRLLLSSPEHRADLMMPNNTRNLTKYSEEVEEIYEIEKEVKDSSKILSFSFNHDMADMFLAGTRGVGGVVLNQNNHILSQLANLKVNSTYKEKAFPWENSQGIVDKSSDLYFSEFQGDQDYSLGKEWDKKRENKILDIISEYINGYVDAVANTFIFSINAGLLVQSVHQYLVRRGLPVKSVIYFMNQPVIRNYVEQVAINNNKLLESSGNSIDKDTIALQLINYHKSKLKELGSGEGVKEYLSAADLKRTMINDKTLQNLSKEQLVKYHQTQLQVFKDFMGYKEQSFILQNTVSAVAVDTHKSKSLKENYVHKHMSKKIFDNNLINSASLERILSNTYLGTYKSAQDDIESLFEDIFPVLNNEGIKRMVNDIMLPYLDNNYMSTDNKISVAEKLGTEILTFIILTYPSLTNTAGQTGSVSDLASSLISPVTGTVDSKSIEFLNNIRRLINSKSRGNVKAIYERNVFLKTLVTVANSGKNKIEAIQLLNKKLTGIEQSVLMEDWEKLMNMTEKIGSAPDSPTIGDIAKNMALLGLLQSGVSYSPFSFINKIPPHRFSRLVTKAFENFNLDKGKLIEFFKEQFYRNNYGTDNNIVPLVKISFDNPFGSIVIGNKLKPTVNFKNYPYLKTFDSKTKDYRLFKALSYNVETKEYNNYIEIPKLGDGNWFKEYKWSTGLSLLDVNNYDSSGIPIDLAGLNTLVGVSATVQQTEEVVKPATIKRLYGFNLPVDKTGKEQGKADLSNAFIGFGIPGGKVKKYFNTAKTQNIPVNDEILASPKTIAFVSVDVRGVMSKENQNETQRVALEILRAGGTIVMDSSDEILKPENQHGEMLVQEKIVEKFGQPKQTSKGYNYWGPDPEAKISTIMSDNIKGDIILKVIQKKVFQKKAVTTIRSDRYHKEFYKGNGVYKTEDGKKVVIEYIGTAIKKGNEIVLNTTKGVQKIDLNTFGKNEGFDDWAGFLKDSKYSKSFIDGTDFRHIYTIKPTDQSIVSPLVNKITKTLNTPEFDKLPASSNKPTFTYAGIGSRETPPAILAQMTAAAKDLEANFGYTLNTGKQAVGIPNLGADAAFAAGATKKNEFGPEDANSRTIAIAREIHPAKEAVDNLDAKYKKPGSTKKAWDLHARNTNQIFGKNLDMPVDFVLVWTEDGATSHTNTTVKTGGSGQAIRMASLKGIPVINMRNPDWIHQVNRILSMNKPNTPVAPVAPIVEKNTTIVPTKVPENIVKKTVAVKVPYERLTQRQKILLKLEKKGEKNWIAMTPEQQAEWLKCN